MAQAEQSGPGQTRPGRHATDLLTLVLRAVASVGTDALTVLRPVHGPGGEVVDFLVVADTGLTAELARQPSLGRTLRELLPDGFGLRLVRLNAEVLASGVIMREDFVLGTDGRGTATPPPSRPDPETVRIGDVLRVPVEGHVVVLWRDVTEARRAQQDLLAAEQRFQRLVEHASETIVVTTADRVITYASPSLGVVLNLDPKSLVGRRWGAFFSPRQDHSVAQDLYDRVLRAPQGGTARAEAEVVRGDGQLRRVAYVATNWLDDPVVGGVVINARDVTDQHELQRDLRQQALTDSLTGLPNRRWFTGALERAIAVSGGTGRPFALLLLDVDNFKDLNDSLGHSAGDRLLVEMSSRMAAVLGPSESIARLGGDEFVVLAEHLDPGSDVDADATSVAGRISAAAGTRYRLRSLDTQATVSVGVVTYAGADGPASTGSATDPSTDLSTDGGTGSATAGHAGADARADGDATVGDGVGQGLDAASREAETLLAHADAALYAAKRRGRNRVEVFEAELRAQLVDRVHLGSELHHALDRGELTLHWQPIVRAADEHQVGGEALVRWLHPRRGLLAAAQFLPVATETGLMPTLCQWALDAALRTAAGWQALPDEPMFFVNLAAAQLDRPTLPDEVAAMAQRYGLDPGRVQLEVPEDVLGADVRRLTDQLLGLRERGFRIALDDFGAGNTALTWLRRLPVDTLKLDRDFALTLCEERTRVVVRSLVQLAADLGVRTVAEGVETRQQLDFYVEVGCDYTQGYLHGRAGPGPEVMGAGRHVTG